MNKRTTNSPAGPGPRQGAANRDKILKAANALFRHKGFHGTSTHEIARRAGVSLGNIYNHFEGKEEIFSTLLADYEKAYFSGRQPLLEVFQTSTFPDNIERIGRASREIIDRFTDYIVLMYVDVAEFRAKHVGNILQRMRERYTRVLKLSFSHDSPPLAPGIDPAGAMMMVTWSFFNYFVAEKLFGVQGHFGMSDDQVIELFADVFRHGLLPHATRLPRGEASRRGGPCPALRSRIEDVRVRAAALSN